MRRTSAFRGNYQIQSPLAALARVDVAQASQKGEIDLGIAEHLANFGHS
jgi:hypothetical protein